MTNQTRRSAEDYTTGKGLRALLERLHAAGDVGWRTDPVARELMVFTAKKYAALARKHGLDPWEASTAAFDIMRTSGVRAADDPWAWITHGVRITCIAEERAQGLLCSTSRARRAAYSEFHDAERFSDRENPLADYRPEFRVCGADSEIDFHEDEPVQDDPSTHVQRAVETAVRLFTSLGWPEATASAAIEHVCEAVARAGSRHGAFEMLRRDRHARALLDLPAPSWAGLLRILLGHPDPARAATRAGHGLLARLLIGESLPMLLADDDLVLAVSLAAPTAGSPR